MTRLSLNRFRRGEEATAATEFVVLFPLVILIFCTAFEAAALTLRQAMLDVAAGEVTRELRLSSGATPGAAELVAFVCDKAVVFPDCENAVSIELAPVDTETWEVSRATMQCIDRDDGFVPVQSYVAGGGNDVMLVRICAVFEPIFPTLGLGAQLTRVNESDYALVAAAAFVNEPI
jgi:hypothetical protein